MAIADAKVWSAELRFGPVPEPVTRHAEPEFGAPLAESFVVRVCLLS